MRPEKGALAVSKPQTLSPKPWRNGPKPGWMHILVLSVATDVAVHQVEGKGPLQSDPLNPKP